LPGDDEPLTVSIDAEGVVFLQELKVELADLVPKLQAVAAERPDLRIFVRGDKSVAYGLVMQVMGTINAAGFGEVGLVTELPTPQRGEG